jgi:nucleoid-associated protein YgaU
MAEERNPQAAGFTNPFKWGKKSKKEDEVKAAAQPSPNPAPTTVETPTPPAATPAPAPAPVNERTYTVKAGDTLWDLAAKYYNDGRKFTKIASANNISDPNRINIGMELKIPE